MFVRSLSRFALLAAALWSAQRIFQAQLARRRAVPAQKPMPIQSWEGEGGAVPVGGGRTAGEVTPKGNLPARPLPSVDEP